MQTRTHLFVAVVASALLLPAAHSNAQAQSVLTGVVSSTEEAVMEGVVVSARKDGSTITVSVVTDDKGRFAFPAARLEPGMYTLKARAAGYEVASAKAADVVAGLEAKSDITLKRVKNLSAHLTNAEWLASMPGTEDQKKFLLNCTSCHTLERIVKSTYDADALTAVIARMSTYYPGSTPQRPQLLTNFTRDRDRGSDTRKIAEWLATVNLLVASKRSMSVPEPNALMSISPRSSARRAAVVDG